MEKQNQYMKQSTNTINSSLFPMRPMAALSTKECHAPSRKTCRAIWGNKRRNSTCDNPLDK